MRRKEFNNTLLLFLLFTVLVFSWQQIKHGYDDQAYSQCTNTLKELNEVEADLNKELLALNYGISLNFSGVDKNVTTLHNLVKKFEEQTNSIKKTFNNDYVDSVRLLFEDRELNIQNFKKKLKAYRKDTAQLAHTLDSLIKIEGNNLYEKHIHYLSDAFRDILIGKKTSMPSLSSTAKSKAQSYILNSNESEAISSTMIGLSSIKSQKADLSKLLEEITAKKFDHYQKDLDAQSASLSGIKSKRAYFFAILMAISIILIFLYFSILLRKELKDKKQLKVRAQILEERIHESASKLESANEKVESLHTDLTKLSLVAKHTSNGVIITDINGKIEWSNQSFESLCGIPSADIYGKNIVEEINFIPFLDIVARLSIIKNNGLESSSEGYNLDVYVDAGNTAKWMNLTATSIPDINSNLDKVLLLLADITERKFIEHELQRSEEMYRNMFQKSPVPMYFVELESLKIFSANQAMLQSYGYTIDELCKMTISDLRPGEEINKLRKEIKEGDIQIKSLTKHILRDGSVIDVELTSNTMYFMGKKARIVIAQNITERKKAEELLRRSEENHRLIFQQSPMPMMILDKENLQFLAINEQAQKYYGYSQNEFFNLSLGDIYVHEEESDSMTITTPNNFSKNTRVNGQCFHKKKDGSQMEIEINSHIISNIDGKEVRLCVVQDITEKKKAERALRETEERFIGFMNHNPATAWIKNKTGKYVYVNKTFEEQFCTTLDEIYGMSDHVLLPHDIADAITEHDNTVINQGCTLEIFENVPTPDGIQRHWHLYKFPLIAPNGEALIGGIAFDITLQKEAEHALGESERRYRLISENIKDVICLHDVDGSYTYISPSIAHLTGYEPEQLIGTTPMIHAHTEDSKNVKDHIKSAAEKKNSSLEYRFKRKDGGYVWLEMTINAILDADKNTYQLQSVSRDITERKKAENELQGSMKSLEKANAELSKAKELAVHSMKIKEEILANTSHEIRTPLNAILGLARILLNTKLNQEQIKYLQAIESSGDALMVVLNDVLDLSKIEAGKMTFEEIPFSLPAVLQSTTVLLSSKATEKGINLAYHIDPNVPENLIGDPSRLKQILINLISNAIKFTMEGGAHVKVSVHDSVQDMFWVEFSIADTGIGIPEHKLQDIFDSFTQGAESTNRKFGGTGLGLTIVKKLVELQSGDIKVESKANKGSTFTLRLPFKISHEKPAIPKHASTLKFLIGKRALLVDDNSLNLLVAARTLQEFGMEVSTASSGKSAISLLETGNFDIMLLDIHMIEMNGYETTSYIRKYLPDPKREIPILAMTASSFSNDEEKFINAGMNGYISKPFDVTKFYNKIAAILIENYNHSEMNEKNTLMPEDGKHINLDYLKELSEGNNEFVEEMISMFMEVIPRSINEMQEALVSSDWKTLHLVSHKIKPSYGFIGQQKGAELLQKIERSAADLPDRENINEWLKELINITDKCIIELKSTLSQ